MSTIFEFSVLFNGHVHVHEQNEQDSPVSVLRGLDDLIMTRGRIQDNDEVEDDQSYGYFEGDPCFQNCYQPYEETLGHTGNGDEADVLNYSYDHGYECVCNYHGHVLRNADTTGSMSHEVTATLWRRFQEEALVRSGKSLHLSDRRFMSHSAQPVDIGPDYDPYMIQDCEIPPAREQAEDHQIMLLQARLVITVNESHELALSSSNESFAAWLAGADRNFLYEMLIRPVFAALEQESESIAKVHTGDLRISGSLSAVSADHISDADSDKRAGEQRAGLIASDCALMTSALLGRNTFKLVAEDPASGYECRLDPEEGLLPKTSSLKCAKHFIENSYGLVFVIGHELYLDMMSLFKSSRYKDFLGRERLEGPQLTALELIISNACFKLCFYQPCVCVVLWPEKEYRAIKPGEGGLRDSIMWLHAHEEDADAAASAGGMPRWTSWWRRFDPDRYQYEMIDENGFRHLFDGFDRYGSPVYVEEPLWPSTCGFVMASADRLADDLKSMYKAQCQKDGREREYQKEYGYWRFVKHLQRKIMVLDYQSKSAMMLSPEFINCSWQDNDLNLPLLFGYEMEFVDMVNLPSFECNDVQSFVSLARVLPVDSLPDISFKIPPDCLRYFRSDIKFDRQFGYSLKFHDKYTHGSKYLYIPRGYTRPGMQRLVDRLAEVKTEDDLMQLLNYLRKFPFKVTISPDSFEYTICLDFLKDRYEENNHSYNSGVKEFHPLGIKGFEWLDDIRDFYELCGKQDVDRAILSHRGLAYVNNLDLLISQAVYDCPVSLELFNSSSFIKEIRNLRKLTQAFFCRYEDSAEFSSLLSCPWCQPDPDTVAMIMSDRSIVTRDEPLAVVDAEFLMGNYHNIRQATGKRTIVIPATVLTALICRRLHFDVAMNMIANHAQRAVIELGDRAVYFTPDFEFTNCLAMASPENQQEVPVEEQDGNDGSEGMGHDRGNCSDSCIATALSLQTYDTVLYTGSKDTARKANFLGVKTVFSGAVNDVYGKQAQLRDQSLRKAENNDDELRLCEDLGLYTYDKSLSLMKSQLDELSWTSSYQSGNPDLPENVVKALGVHEKKLRKEIDRAKALLRLCNPYQGLSQDYTSTSSLPPAESVYRKQLHTVRRGRTDLSRELIDKRMLITAEGMKKWTSEGVRDGLISPDESMFGSPDMKSLVERLRSWSESSEKQSDGDDS